MSAESLPSLMRIIALTQCCHVQAVQEVFGSDVESDSEEEPEPAGKPSRKRAADGEPKRPPAKRKSRSRTVFGACTPSHSPWACLPHQRTASRQDMTWVYPC